MVNLYGILLGTELENCPDKHIMGTVIEVKDYLLKKVHTIIKVGRQ